jgi:hypothetical protein
MESMVREFSEKHGGTWGEHPDYLVSDWQNEVATGDTRMGYWDWAHARHQEKVQEELGGQESLPLKESIATLSAMTPEKRIDYNQAEDIRIASFVESFIKDRS